jgi:hypothetical protein
MINPARERTRSAGKYFRGAAQHLQWVSSDRSAIKAFVKALVIGPGANDQAYR